MTGLRDLPFETLQQICELVAGPQPSNLVSFSEVSKECLAASSQSLWRIIPLRIASRDQILESVDRLKHVFHTRLSRDVRVRCISISCRLPWGNRRDTKDPCRPKGVYLDDIAWHPLADVLAEIPPLSEMEWEDDKLPPCILPSLDLQHPGCRLWTTGVKCGVDKPIDIDEQPAKKLSFMYELLLPLQNDYACRESLNELYYLVIVGSLSASLTQSKHRDTYPSIHHCVQQPDPSEFELVLRNRIGPRMRYKVAILSSLDFLS